MLCVSGSSPKLTNCTISGNLADEGGGVYELDLRQGEEALLYCRDRVPEPTVEPLPAQEGKCNRYGLTK